MQANLILSGSNPTSSKAPTGPSNQSDVSFEAIFGMIAPQAAPARPDGDLNALLAEPRPVQAESDEFATDLDESAEPSNDSGAADIAVAELPPAPHLIPAAALPSTQEDGFDFNDVAEGHPPKINAPSNVAPPEEPANSQLIVVEPNGSASVENTKIETIIPSSFKAGAALTQSANDRTSQSIDQTAVRHAENGSGAIEGLHPREQKLSGGGTPSRPDTSTLLLAVPNKGVSRYAAADFAAEAVAIDGDTLEQTSLKLPPEKSNHSYVVNIFNDIPELQTGDRVFVTSKQILAPYSPPQEASAPDGSRDPLNVEPEKPSTILKAYKTDGEAVVPSTVAPSKAVNNEIATEPARTVPDDAFVKPHVTGRADAPSALPPPPPTLNGPYTEVSPASEPTVNFGPTEAMVTGVEEQTIKRTDPSDIMGKAVRTPPPEPVRQIADAIVLTKNGTIEIMLEPVELGRVTLILGTDSSMSVGVIAERPETMDLIRRHSDQLLRDLRDSGMQDARLDFLRQDGKGDNGGGSAPPWNRGAGNSGTASTGGTSPLEEPEANSNNAPSHLGRLDIRL